MNINREVKYASIYSNSQYWTRVKVYDGQIETSNQVVIQPVASTYLFVAYEWGCYNRTDKHRISFKDNNHLINVELVTFNCKLI